MSWYRAPVRVRRLKYVFIVEDMLVCEKGQARRIGSTASYQTATGLRKERPISCVSEVAVVRSQTMMQEYGVVTKAQH